MAGVELVESKVYGKLVGMTRGRVEAVDLSVVEGQVKPVDMSLFETAEIFFG